MNDTILTSDTTLYCVTENKNTPQVIWIYTDPAGTTTFPVSTLYPSTGVSFLPIQRNEPGYYSCEVSEGGITKLYSATMSNYYTGTATFTLGVITSLWFPRAMRL